MRIFHESLLPYRAFNLTVQLFQMLPSILTYLAYRKFLVFEWEQVNQQAQNQPAAVAAPAPPVLVHVDGYHAPVGQNDPADVGAGASAGSDEESGEQESSSHSEAHPGAGAGAGVAEDLSASESSNLCCICMANPKNSVIYRYGYLARRRCDSTNLTQRIHFYSHHLDVVISPRATAVDKRSCATGSPAPFVVSALSM